MSDSKCNIINKIEGKGLLDATIQDADSNRSIHSKDDDSAAVVLMELALFPTKIIVREVEADVRKADAKQREVRIANACDFHKRKHQKCPLDCNYRKKKSRKRKIEEKTPDYDEEDKSTQPLQRAQAAT